MAWLPGFYERVPGVLEGCQFRELVGDTFAVECTCQVRVSSSSGLDTGLTGIYSACITALSNSSHGIVVLPTAIQLSKALATLAMMLDKRPDLTRRLRKVTDQGETRKTLVESTAESIQRAFTMCLTERSSNRNGIGRDGKPEGKKIGIYSFANLALKLFFKVYLNRSL